MVGRLQKLAAMGIVALSLWKPVEAASPFDIYGAGAFGRSDLALPAQGYGQAGATLRPANGWNASVFVTSFDPRPSTDDDPARVRSATFVSGRITRYLTRTTRVSLDVFNLLDKRVDNVDYFASTRLWTYPGAADNFLFYPGESRGVRLRLRTTF